MAPKITLNEAGVAELKLGDRTLLITATDEGIALDVWPDDKPDDLDGPDWSMWLLYSEMVGEEGE